MPIYRCAIPAGSLTDEQKRQLAEEFTTIHCALTNGTPRKFVHVTFQEAAPGDAWSGGSPSTVAKIIGLIRTGRSQETRSALVTQLVEAWAKVTGQDRADIIVALHEVRPADVMEWGELLPADGEEADWVAQHGLESAGVVAT
jgi:phenylpyruvate tautomerase PptA (4-oxalocrotonate tautomerase family)